MSEKPERKVYIVYYESSGIACGLSSQQEANKLCDILGSGDDEVVVYDTIEEAVAADKNLRYAITGEWK